MGSLPQHVSIAPAILLSLLIFVYIRSVVNWRARSRGRPLPPGPTPLPFLGNIFSVPKFRPWVRYRDLCLKYGDIVQVTVRSQRVVVLGSPSVIFEFLDKRSANTSDRKLTTTMDLIGIDTNFGFQAYGTRWRNRRRAFWQHFNQRAYAQYHPVQRAMAHKFLLKLLHEPSNLKYHIRYTFSATLMKIIYDIDVAEKNDEYISQVIVTLEAISQGLVPGKYLVEFLPFLRHVPAWIPGAGFQKVFAGWRIAAENVRNVPFAHMKQAMEDGGAKCIASSLLTEYNTEEWTPEEREDIAKDIGLVTFEAGSDTTFSITEAAFLALSLHPDVLKKAQEELDAVVGPHRLPDFSDLDSLVYLNALVKEAMRWHNVVPLCLPHCTMADDELHGYFIPAGTVLLPNIWACMHDPEVYVNPDDFYPDRFIKDGRLDPDIRDPADYVFGFGRRVCPGRYFAKAAMFINLASIIHVFDITPPLDAHGSPIRIVPQATDGILSYPEDCRCTIKPRSAAAEALILAHARAVELTLLNR